MIDDRSSEAQNKMNNHEQSSTCLHHAHYKKQHISRLHRCVYRMVNT